MKHALTIFLVLFLFTSTSVHAEEPQQDTSKYEDLNKLSQELANCGGVYIGISHVMTEVEKKNAAQTFEDTARGAMFSAAYLKFMTGKIPEWQNALEWATNIKKAQTSYWLGLLELHTPTEEEEEALPNTFTNALKACTALTPIQTSVIQQMRETIYSLEPNK